MSLSTLRTVRIEPDHVARSRVPSLSVHRIDRDREYPSWPGDVSCPTRVLFPCPDGGSTCQSAWIADAVDYSAPIGGAR